MLVHKAKFASLLCATLVLQGCVTARYTTENGTRVTPDVIQSYVNGDNVTPFFPYRTEHFDSKLEMLDRQRAMYNITPTDELNQQLPTSMSPFPSSLALLLYCQPVPLLSRPNASVKRDLCHPFSLENTFVVAFSDLTQGFSGRNSALRQK